jgi:hypothetical protein
MGGPHGSTCTAVQRTIEVGTDPAAIVDEVALDVAIDLGLAFHEAWESLLPVGQERVLTRARVLAAQRLSGGS